MMDIVITICDHKKPQSFSTLAFHVGRHSRFAAELVPHAEVEINREATSLPLQSSQRLSQSV